MGGRDSGDGVPTLQEAREAIVAYLEGLPLAAHAAAILDFVGEHGEEPFGFAEAVQAAGGADLGEVMATLSHLSQGRRPPLTKSVVFVDADGAEHIVGGGVNGYMDGEPYAHPVTGEAVPEATKSMYFRFQPVPGLLREHASAPTP